LLLGLNDLDESCFWEQLRFLLPLYTALFASDTRFKSVRTTAFAVKFTFFIDGISTECDLLPVPMSLWRKEHAQVLEQASGLEPYQQRYYSAVLGKWQVRASEEQLTKGGSSAPRYRWHTQLRQHLGS
jgi:hypothetical protein